MALDNSMTAGQDTCVRNEYIFHIDNIFVDIYIQFRDYVFLFYFNCVKPVNYLMYHSFPLDDTPYT